MFSDHRLTIEDLLRNGKVPSPIQDGITPPSFTGNLRTLTAQLPLSERIARPERYEALRDARRNALEIFLKHPLDSGTLAAIGDLVMAILEEPTWVSPMHSLMDDDASPIIDFEVAETAVLLGWTLRIAGDSLKTVHPQLTRRTVLELRSRVFKPILQHARLPFIKGKGSAPIAICVDIVLTAMLAEPDERRRSSLLTELLKVLDELASAPLTRFRPLRGFIRDVSALCDFAYLLRRMTRNQLDLTQSVPSNAHLDEILFAWICNDRFIDPCGDNTPPSGADIFRIGNISRDDALPALGASIDHAAYRPSDTVTGRFFEDGFAQKLDMETDIPVHSGAACLNHFRLMTGSIANMFAAVHIGTGRRDCGSFLIYDGSTPIVDLTANAPLIGGERQDEKVVGIGDMKRVNEKDIMSVDLTGCYPHGLANSVQRTLIMLGNEKTVQLVDAFELYAPQTISLSFVTQAHATVLRDAVRFGGVRLTWEADMDVSSVPAENGGTCLTFTTRQPLKSAMLTFKFEHS